MSDLRERVEEDRGLLKRIQLHVPGFAGYRRREDLRQAENMLRIQMANGLKSARETTEEARERMVEENHYKEIDRVGRLLNRFRTLEGRVRHAEGGYSGISPAIRIEDAEINRLYEYDASLLDDASALAKETAELKVAAGEGKGLRKRTKEIRSHLDAFEDTFEKRMLVVSDTEVAE
ncbi:MAG: hypothetical protein LN413_03995 [Candidatus Thermoplasmatota archaeon]|nr:hypothetical protein [Candidatus Thermoplasmatota archaeon]